MSQDIVNVNGRKFEGYKIDLYGANLLILKGQRGFIACGYINPATADKMGQACAIVTGVKSYDDMLSATVVNVSKKASDMGVNAGVSGKEALGIFAK